MPGLPATVVVPCYNEASRLSTQAFIDSVPLLDGVRFLFVDDGSTDATQEVLGNLCTSVPGRWIALKNNSGKGEAVRQGLIEASKESAIVAFLDSDLSAPISEILRLISILRQDSAKRDVVLGSRVLMLGREIHRRGHRHILGRCFATIASWVLRLPVYDTQCGAKVFVVNDGLRKALARPFLSRWAFDVELIGRLARDNPQLRIWEEPLLSWGDRDGSKLRFSSMFRALLDLFRIRRDLHS